MPVCHPRRPFQFRVFDHVVSPLVSWWEAAHVSREPNSRPPPTVICGRQNLNGFNAQENASRGSYLGAVANTSAAALLVGAPLAPSYNWSMLQGGEILIILIVALLVLGPERLPMLARKAGEWTQKMRRAASDLTSDLEKEVNELKELADEAGRPISEIRRELRKSVDEVGMSRLDWVGPKPKSGPGPEQAIRDLDRIEGRRSPAEPEPDDKPTEEEPPEAAGA